jgi:HD-GYP domain-containing protein (c-di-GMP phosphodiesterase class II)
MRRCQVAAKKTGPKDVNREIKRLEAANRELLKSNRALARGCQKQSRQAGLIKEMAQLNTKSFKLAVFLDRLMDRVVAATGSESATLFLHDPLDQTLEFTVVKGPSAQKLAGRRIPANEGIVGEVMRTGAPYFAADVSRDQKWDSRVAKELKHATHNILAAPLKLGGKTAGVIEVLNKCNGEAFTRDDLALLKSLALEVAIGLANARLLLEARRRADQFTTLSRLSTILNSTLRPKEVRQRAMEAAVELLACETGSLYLIDEAKGELYFEVALGDKGAAVKEIRLKMGEGIAGWVAQEGKSDLVPDTSRDPRWSRRADDKSKFQTRNMVTVPVRAKGKIIGVLQALNKLHGKKFDVEDQRLMESLADQVAIALENARLYEEQKQMFTETAAAMATAIEKRDPYTGGHTRRVRDFSMASARYLDLTDETREWLELAAILHDIGKIGVDDEILRKPGRLSDEEFTKMKMHPVFGHEILTSVKQLGPAVPGVKYHHERFDGKGYPEQIGAPDLPLIARIITVADTWDAMTSDRPYRKGLADEVANQELIKCSGGQFDPVIVEAFLKAYRNGEIKSQHAVE